MAIDHTFRFLSATKDAEANAALIKLRIWYAEILGEKKEKHDTSHRSIGSASEQKTRRFQDLQCMI